MLNSAKDLFICGTDRATIMLAAPLVNITIVKAKFLLKQHWLG